MTAKRFITEMGSIKDNKNNCLVSLDLNDLSDLLNELYEENYELKEVIEEVFEVITNLDYVRGQYLNALLNVLGEENDVNKTKERIKEFLND